MIDSKENYKFDLGVKGLNKSRCWKVDKVHALSVENKKLKLHVNVEIKLLHSLFL